ncbi:DUF1153 domain-containing protein [Planktomarina temperata]|nr:DUF1153 domain-containing protein [Planktomarina temperata]
MHIRKVRGPRTVQLPDGGYLSRGDLPPPTTKRWVASRKAHHHPLSQKISRTTRKSKGSRLSGVMTFQCRSIASMSSVRHSQTFKKSSPI